MEQWEPSLLIQALNTLSPKRGVTCWFHEGKFYNRCTKIHQILATVMERELFSKYLKLMEDEEESLQSPATEKMSNYNIDVEHCQDVVVNVSSIENFFCDGKFGSTAAYWAIYVYFINRVNWQLQRAVRTNDVDGYIHVLSSIIEVFFALNCPNYGRWCSLFLHKLQQIFLWNSPQDRQGNSHKNP